MMLVQDGEAFCSLPRALEYPYTANSLSLRLRPGSVCKHEYPGAVCCPTCSVQGLECPEPPATRQCSSNSDITGQERDVL